MDKIINKKFNEDCEEDLSQKLSGGEKKRICILRGLIQDREVYIFDEPTNELDAENTRAVLKEINKLKKKATYMLNCYTFVYKEIKNISNIFLWLLIFSILIIGLLPILSQYIFKSIISELGDIIYSNSSENIFNCIYRD